MADTQTLTADALASSAETVRLGKDVRKAMRAMGDSLSEHDEVYNTLIQDIASLSLDADPRVVARYLDGIEDTNTKLRDARSSFNDLVGAYRKSRDHSLTLAAKLVNRVVYESTANIDAETREALDLLQTMGA